MVGALHVQRDVIRRRRRPEKSVTDICTTRSFSHAWRPVATGSWNAWAATCEPSIRAGGKSRDQISDELLPVGEFRPISRLDSNSRAGWISVRDSRLSSMAESIN